VPIVYFAGSAQAVLPYREAEKHGQKLRGIALDDPQIVYVALDRVSNTPRYTRVPRFHSQHINVPVCGGETHQLFARSGANLYD
jgi:hypothetical protein